MREGINLVFADSACLEKSLSDALSIIEKKSFHPLWLHKRANNHHLPLTQLAWLVAYKPPSDPCQPLADWDLRQAYILHHCPDDGQATVFGREGINLIRALPNIAEKTF